MDKQIRHWWKEDEATIPESIGAIIGELDSEQGYRTQANLRNLRMYTNLAVLGLSASEYASDESSLPTDRLTLNVVESVIETAKALISTNKPKIRFLTEGGSRKARRKAQDMTRFASGQFHAAGVYTKAQEAFGDACSMGTGFLRIYEEDNEVKTERVFSDEIMIDDVEGKYGEPRSLYMHKEIERTVLEAVYPEKEFELEESGKMREEGAFLMGLADPVGVVEAWHLPSKKDAGDGRHVITCDNVCLLSEEWSGSRFPFAVFRWTTRPLGFWGKGIPEILRGIQIEINMILQKTQRLMNLASSKVFVQKGSKINTSKLNNEEWGIVEYAGEKPPVFATVAAIAPEYAQQLERLYVKAFELSGVSQLSAQSRKPVGLDSGRAIMEYNDIQTQRFLHTGQRWECLFLDIADLAINCAKEISKSGSPYTIMAEKDDCLVPIDWSDIDPGKEQYRMKAWPVSLLPDHPSGKLQMVQTLIQLDPRLQPYAMDLLKYPDIDAMMKRVNAPMRLMDKVIEAILDEDKVIPPEPYMDLRMGVSMMQYAYMNAKIEEADEPVLGAMRAWMDQAMGMVMAAEAAMAPPPMLAGEQPVAAGGGPQAQSSGPQPQGAKMAPVQAMTGL